MTITAEYATTLAEALAAVGIDPAKLDGLDQKDITRPVIVTPAWTQDTGAMQVSCGGECLFRITWMQDRLNYGSPGHTAFPERRFIEGNRRHGYIVRDDQDGQTWDYRRREGRSTETSYRPHPRIRFAYSG